MVRACDESIKTISACPALLRSNAPTVAARNIALFACSWILKCGISLLDEIVTPNLCDTFRFEGVIKLTQDLVSKAPAYEPV